MISICLSMYRINSIIESDISHKGSLLSKRDRYYLTRLLNTHMLTYDTTINIFVITATKIISNIS